MDARAVDNAFAPMTAKELRATNNVTTAGDMELGEIVSPIPSHAPPMPTRHPGFGEPVAHWPYHDKEGHVSFIVLRFEPVGERKQVIPLTLWRDKLGQMRWRWKGFPAPRMLFNLDAITNKPDLPVFVVEGEKKVAAVEKIYAGAVVATTSCGGSQAADKTDWTPLAGRRVLVWPDADEPGSKYAEAVGNILVGLGCEVNVLDAMSLAKLAPSGGEREVAEGWDAADAVEEWSNLALLKRAIKARVKKFECGPNYVSHGDFEMSDGGLTYQATKGRGDNARTVEEWVSGAFEIMGEARDTHGREWSKVLKWKDGDGRHHVRHISAAMLQGDPAALAASLASDGLRINRLQQKSLAQYLCGAIVKDRVTMVSRTGWHAIAGHSVFVLPNETIGPRGADKVILDAAAVGPYEARGTLADWQEGVGALASGHALAVLAISAALAGPLLYLAGQEGGGVNFFGPSSKGKSTLLQIAASVWGRGGSPGFVRAWRATANGLEGAAASASDTALILDELGVVEARDAGSAVYSLSNGGGKQRSARDGSLREPKSWRVLVLSSGEVPVETKLAEDRGRRARAGQLVRLLDIPVDRGFGYGAFDNGGPDNDAGAIAKRFKTAAQNSYGTAGPEFVRNLISNGIDGETVRAMVSDFVESSKPAGADGQIDRAAQRLGVIMAAGDLAVAFGLVPWPHGAVRTAAAWALKVWIEGRGGKQPAEVRQAIEAVRLIIEQHGDSRFEDIDVDDDKARVVSNRLGWRSGNGEGREWMIPAEIWRTEICAGLDPKFVARVLAERGMLVEATDGKQPTRRIKGRVTRVYVVTPAIFEDDGNGNKS